ncbi:MAG: hypothetical protein CMI23_09490 [Opitutae bacterium]|nr:hypothetical protein [Opitutae bacterium]
MISNQFYLFLFLIFFQLAYSKVNNPDPERFLDSFETFKKLDQQTAPKNKKAGARNLWLYCERFFGRLMQLESWW